MKVSGRYLLDTNVIVDFFKGDQAIRLNLGQGEFFIPSIVIGELYYGAYASGLVTKREKRLNELSSFLSIFPVLEVGEKTANHYGFIKSQLKSMGKPIPENDIWIAAMAIENGLPLVTRDHHFTNLPELIIEKW